MEQQQFDIPPGVEVVVGYSTGTATYRRGDKVRLEAGMKMLAIRTIPGEDTPKQVPAQIPPTPMVVFAMLMFYVGLSWLLIKWLGPGAVMVFGLLLLWARGIVMRAKQTVKS